MPFNKGSTDQTDLPCLILISQSGHIRYAVSREVRLDL